MGRRKQAEKFLEREQQDRRRRLRRWQEEQAVVAEETRLAIAEFEQSQFPSSPGNAAPETPTSYDDDDASENCSRTRGALFPAAWPLLSIRRAISPATYAETRS